ncbi:MAG: lipoprotein signal peptidase [Bacteroidales bacterium]
MKISRATKLTIIAIIILVIDQVVKVLVKTNMCIGESISVLGNWFQLLFVENKGMAFGMVFGGNAGKLFLTLFRIALVIFLFYYIKKLLKSKHTPIGVEVGLMLILVGALGNIIDSMFYGLLFSESTVFTAATFWPNGGGYAPLMMGKVVDMLYFPVIQGILPDWFPYRGGEQFIFFRPIFNIADSCITIGAFYLIIFKWKYFAKK